MLRNIKQEKGNNVGEGGGLSYKVTFKFKQRIKEGASQWEIGVRLLQQNQKQFLSSRVTDWNEQERVVRGEVRVDGSGSCSTYR